METDWLSGSASEEGGYRDASEDTNLGNRMMMLLPETRKARKRERITELVPLIWRWPRTSGLDREIRQVCNQYKYSNYKSELLMRYWVWNCISGLANEEFFLLEGSFLKEVTLVEKARIFDTRRKVLLCVWKTVGGDLLVGNREVTMAPCLGNASSSP